MSFTQGLLGGVLGTIGLMISLLMAKQGLFSLSRNWLSRKGILPRTYPLEYHLSSGLLRTVYKVHPDDLPTPKESFRTTLDRRAEAHHRRRNRGR